MKTRIAKSFAVILYFTILGLWCYRPSLHVAAFHGNTVYAKVYLRLGADVNRRKPGWGYKTPLDVASSSEMRQLLKEHGGQSGK